MKNKMLKSCVVLGGGGFLGLNLCRRLAASGVRVRAFGRRSLFPEFLKEVEWYQGNFSDPSAVASAIESFDVIFHLIHDSTPQSATLDMIGDVEHNLVPTLSLIKIAREVGSPRIIFISSGGTVYGQVTQIPTPETAPTDPITAYGVSKLAIEKYLNLAERLYGLEHRVLRLTNPFGPFQVALKNQGLIAAAISRALSDQTIEIWGDGTVVRDFLFVDDTIDALIAAANHEGKSRVFNIGSGQGRRVIDVVAAIEHVLNRKLKIRCDPQRPIDVPTSIVSIDRARNELGWSPKISFESGLQKTIEWWRTHEAKISHIKNGKF
ncbi:MAG: UDP-glucose 4-epimerase [Pseudolabrys sp.]|nr:UDP-glucose 4-epimerase [Pseudolabrys sp.]